MAHIWHKAQMKIKMKIQTDTRRAAPYPVCVYISSGAIAYRIATGIRSDVPFTGISFPADERNSVRKTMRLGDIYTQCEDWLLQHPACNIKEAATAIRGIINPDKAKGGTLAEYCNRYAATLAKPGTAAFYTRTAARIVEFAPADTFADVNTSWLASFDTFLSSRGVSVNGRAIYMRCLRAVFNRAIDNEETTNYPFRRYAIKTEKTAHRALTDEQLKAIKEYPLQCDWREIYRDLFILSFYLCGINARDLLELPADAVQHGRLQYRRRKTGHLFNIVVVQQAAAIIERYRGKKLLLSPLEHYANYYDFLHHWNDALKKIGDVETVPDKVGKKRKLNYIPIEPKLSTYYARHTWATIAAKLGISREVIAQCLGHTWADVTAIYIAPDVSAQDAAIKKVADFLSAT